MGRKKTPGLYKRNDVWHIDKQINGTRICESTGTSTLEEAERYLTSRSESIRLATLYGVRPKRTFREAATKYLVEKQHKARLADDALCLKKLDSFIGEFSLEQIHMGSLQSFVITRKKEGCKNKTINLALGVVRHILNLAATEWMDGNGLTWLSAAPKIKLLPLIDARPPYPLSFQEQEKLFHVLPLHLKRMALFKVNTGCREQEVCQLQWEWEVMIPELEASVFLIPSHQVKNREERLVVLNSIAKSVIDEVRGQHPRYVFTYQEKPVARINNSAWKRARKMVDLNHVRIHDLKHTFGRRLRAAGVSFEDRQDLLGHKSGRITTHYSAAELGNLIEAANKVCHFGEQHPTLTLLKRSCDFRKTVKDLSGEIISTPAKIPQAIETLKKSDVITEITA